jgi:hypothetical protein
VISNKYDKKDRLEKWWDKNVFWTLELKNLTNTDLDADGEKDDNLYKKIHFGASSMVFNNKWIKLDLRAGLNQGYPTYGLERLASYIQEVDSVYDIEWADGVKYGEIFIQPEYEHSKYSFEVSDQDMLLENFTKFEKEAERALEEGLVHPAFDYVLKCSHTFNLLDARGAVSVTERAGYIARIRNLARVVAKTFVAERKKLGFPLLDEATRAELLKEDAE